MNRRRTVAIGAGALFIWWGIQAGFILGTPSPMWFGTFVGGFFAGIGAAETGFDGVVEAMLALGVVVVVAGCGVAAWTVAEYGLDPLVFITDALAVVSLAIVSRLRFLPMVALGGGLGGYLNGRYV